MTQLMSLLCLIGEWIVTRLVGNFILTTLSSLLCLIGEWIVTPDLDCSPHFSREVSPMFNRRVDCNKDDSTNRRKVSPSVSPMFNRRVDCNAYTYIFPSFCSLRVSPMFNRRVDCNRPAAMAFLIPADMSLLCLIGEWIVT